MRLPDSMSTKQINNGTENTFEDFNLIGEDFDPLKLDDDMDDLFKNKNNLSGRNNRYLNRQKQKLVLSKNNPDKLKKIYNELGLDNKGMKKPKTCWKFVKNGSCSHYKKVNKEGVICKNLWHPGIDERLYLKSKMK